MCYADARYQAPPVLTNFGGPERDYLPVAGTDAALGSPYNTGGKRNTDSEAAMAL